MTFDPAAGSAAAALRQAFDRSFAEAPSLDDALVHDLLDVTAGSARYAMRVTELSALLADTRITPMATPVSGLLGIVAIRGSMLPVYDLATLLGHAPEPSPRWIAVAAGETPVGLAFARFEGQLRVRAEAMLPDAAAAVHVREIIRLGDGHSRPLVSVPSIIHAIADRARAARANE